MNRSPRTSWTSPADQFELAATELNALWRRRRHGGDVETTMGVSRELDPAVGSVTTDGERLRLALGNL